jgi:hypothetical protein
MSYPHHTPQQLGQLSPAQLQQLLTDASGPDAARSKIGGEAGFCRAAAVRATIGEAGFCRVAMGPGPGSVSPCRVSYFR